MAKLPKRTPYLGPDRGPPSPFHGPGPDDEAQAEWDASLMQASPQQMRDFIDALLAIAIKPDRHLPGDPPSPGDAEEEEEAPGGPRINSIPGSRPRSR